MDSSAEINTSSRTLPRCFPLKPLDTCCLCLLYILVQPKRAQSPIMFKHFAPCLLSAQVLLFGQALAQASCSALFTPTYPSPSLASGYQARLIATGLTRPRAMVVDANDNLLVAEVGRGVTSHSIVDDSGCVSLANSHDVVVDSEVRVCPTCAVPHASLQTIIY